MVFPNIQRIKPLVQSPGIKSVFILLLTVIAMLPLQRGEFILLDDNEYVTENPFVVGGLTFENMKWAFTRTHSGHWHPLTWISLMADVQLFGLNPRIMRVENVLLHALSAILLYLSLRMLSRKEWLSFVVAAIFAVHPLRLESVLWISQRKDVLAMLGFSAAFVSYARYLEFSNRGSWLLTGLFLALGLLAKPTLVVAPGLLFLGDRFLSIRRRPLSHSIVDTAPFLLLSAGAAFAALLGQASAGALKGTAELGWEARFANVTFGYVLYVVKFFYPFDLGVFYPLRQVSVLSGVVSATFLVIISFLAISQRVARPYVLFGWSWFLVAQLPTCGLVQVGWQQLADRWTYLPHIGLIVAIVWSLADILRTWTRLLPVLTASVIAVLTFETRNSVSTWLSSIPLFERTIVVAPENFVINTNLGVAYERSGRRLEAFYQYQEALRINPNYPVALNNMGALLAINDRLGDAIPYFSRALSVAPKYEPARYHLGLAFERLQQRGAALREYAKLLSLAPSHVAGREGFIRIQNTLKSLGCDGSWGEEVTPGLGLALAQIRDSSLDYVVQELRALPCVD